MTRGAGGWGRELIVMRKCSPTTKKRSHEVDEIFRACCGVGGINVRAVSVTGKFYVYMYQSTQWLTIGTKMNGNAFGLVAVGWFCDGLLWLLYVCMYVAREERTAVASPMLLTFVASGVGFKASS